MTIKELFEDTVRRLPTACALRYKAEGQWRTRTYEELKTRVRNVASMLHHLGVRKHDRVALLSENCPEWIESYLAIVGLAATVVPVDARLREQEVSHILNDSGTKLLIANAKQYPVVSELDGKIRHLQHLILIQGEQRVDPSGLQSLRSLDYESAFTEHAQWSHGDVTAYDSVSPAEDDLASLIYTSGTTGRPKGAMLTHRNFTANVESCRKAIEIHPDDRFLLVLPLHHSFAFTANFLVPIRCGCEIIFVESLKTVGENLRETSPTILIGVPLLLEKMYQRIMNTLRARRLAYWMFQLGIRRPIVAKIREHLGGKLRLIVTGGAACDPDIINGYAQLGIPVLEGYGLTETSPVVTLNPESRPKPGTVGKPLPDVEVKIVDPGPDGTGEIAVRGSNVMKGYFNNPEATREVFRDGWLLTGDLGYLDSDGYIVITGRKKNVIVNREGKNIYPEEVEQQILKSSLIREALVLGYRDPDMKIGEQVAAIVVPNQDNLDQYLAKQRRNLMDDEVEQLIRDEVKKYVAQLADYKRPRRIVVRWEEFEKTSTGKIKRYLYSA